MMLRRLLTLLLSTTLCLALLSACGKQAAEDAPGTQPTSGVTQPQTESAGLEEGELPDVTVPQQTQPVTGSVVEPPSTENTDPTEPSEETQPTEVSEPSQPTQPTETVPPETTQPVEPDETTPPATTEPTEQPRLDEDELPPIPVF